tara:strand:- start:2163 stop:2594 length:432 start_codon:yes stop_codon:yes gene_type:complete
MSADDNLSKIFDIDPMDKNEVIKANGEVLPPKSKKMEENINYDYDKTRDNLHGLLNQGQDALYNALEIAKQSEHPRAFEVVGNLIKQLSEVNAQLLELHDKKQKLDTPKGSDKNESKQVTNNAIFVGSTSELNKLISDINKGE